jgi:ornithine cyclodeaminase/alanine dehydrogenase-like protein (mu-crystallin family)
VLFLNNEDVHQLLSMKDCLEALEVGYRDLAVGNAVHRPRLDVWAPSDEQDAWFRWGSRKHAETDFRPFHFAGYTAGQPEEIDRIPRSRVEIDEEQYPKLVDVVGKTVAGRSSPDEITCFINIGTQGLQFASVGAKVYQLAKERKVGRELPTEWFVQDVRDQSWGGDAKEECLLFGGSDDNTK